MPLNRIMPFNLSTILCIYSKHLTFLQIQTASYLLQEKLSDDDEEDEDKYADDVIIPGQKFDSKR